MSQSYTKPTNADNLSDGRSKVNDCLDAVRSLFSGSSAPASPVAYQLWADTTNKWLYSRNPANTAWVAVCPISGDGGNVIHLAKWVTYANQGVDVTVGYLPDNHVVTAAAVITTELFNASGTDTISVGYSGASTAYVNAADVSATGKDVGAGAVIDQYVPTAKTVLARYTAGSGTPTTGKALVLVTAYVVPVQP